MRGKHLVTTDNICAHMLPGSMSKATSAAFVTHFYEYGCSTLITRQQKYWSSPSHRRAYLQGVDLPQQRPDLGRTAQDFRAWACVPAGSVFPATVPWPRAQGSGVRVSGHEHAYLQGADLAQQRPGALLGAGAVVQQPHAQALRQRQRAPVLLAAQHAKLGVRATDSSTGLALPALPACPGPAPAPARHPGRHKALSLEE